MDLSKLPKLSGSDGSGDGGANVQSPISTLPPTLPPAAGVTRSPGGFAEAWLGVAIGAILLLMSPRLFHYFLFPATFAQKYGQALDEQGNPIRYTQSVFFWGDVVVVAFALTLIVEGLVLGFARRPVWAALAIGFAGMVTAANLVYVAFMMLGGYGLQLYSAVAVALGVYACLILSQRYRELRGLA